MVVGQRNQNELSIDLLERDLECEKRFRLLDTYHLERVSKPSQARN